jgi:phosphate transport system permease protein
MSLFVNKLEFEIQFSGWINVRLLVLPVIIRTTEESLKAVDDTFSKFSFGLGVRKRR